MPAKYEHLRDALAAKGEKDPAGMAARIFNARRKPGETPMGPNYEQRAARQERTSPPWTKKS